MRHHFQEIEIDFVHNRITMQNEYKLIFPNEDYEEAWKKYINDCLSNDKKVIPASLLDYDYKHFLNRIIDYANGINLPENYVKSKLFFMVNATNPLEIIGVVDIRLENNDNISNYFGNIGISVNPMFRQQHVGVTLLSLAFQIMKDNGFLEAIYCYEKNNIASGKLISKFNIIDISNVTFCDKQYVRCVVKI